MENLANGVFPDLSGHGNDADCQQHLELGGTSYDQCPVAAVGPDGTTAAQFTGSTCHMDSQYLGITSGSTLDHLTSGSLAVWVSRSDSETPYYNDKIIGDFGNYQPNTWRLGRNYDPWDTFYLNNDVGEATNLLSFPGAHAPSGSWAHYVVTWDGSTIHGYYNGVPFAQASLERVSHLGLGAFLAIAADNHDSARNTPDDNCWVYYGFPKTQAYVYPNNGFFTGRLADIRIYDRPLSDGEAASLASAASAPPYTFVLAVAKAGDGTGMVAGQEAGIGCGRHCAEAVASNQPVTLVATPDVGSVFSGWSGACTGTAPCVLRLAANQTATATFTRVTQTVHTFSAASGTIRPPFMVKDGIVFQYGDTFDPTQGGRAEYVFTAPQDGQYIVTGRINAQDWSTNSFYVNVDAEPTASPVDMTWKIPITIGFQERNASWIGSGSSDSPEFPTKVFTLSAGTHSLIIRGRNGNTDLDSVSIALQP
jgi:hypothetical protein